MKKNNVKAESTKQQKKREAEEGKKTMAIFAGCLAIVIIAMLLYAAL